MKFKYKNDNYKITKNLENHKEILIKNDVLILEFSKIIRLGKTKYIYVENLNIGENCGNIYDLDKNDFITTNWNIIRHSDNFLAIKENNKFGIINLKNDNILDIIYSDKFNKLRYLTGNFFIGKTSNEQIIINDKFEEFMEFENTDQIYSNFPNIFIIDKNKKTIILNTKFKILSILPYNTCFIDKLNDTNVFYILAVNDFFCYYILNEKFNIISNKLYNYSDAINLCKELENNLNILKNRKLKLKFIK
jgi:hypothetical protein